jgi:hypothetical protein
MKIILFALLILSLHSSCNQSVKPEQLFGTWRYTKVDYPNQKPAAGMSNAELRSANPSIVFSKNMELKIIWGGKLLSSGTFRMDGKMIRYKENLQNGATREFPFLVEKISSEQLIFSTMEQDASRITAQKVKN